MKNYFKMFLLFAVAILLFSSCAQTEPVQSCIASTSVVHGFWFGLWNGMTVGFSFIGSLFNKTIAIYAINNNGGWYDFGFVLGVGGLGGVIKLAGKVIVAIFD